MTITGLLLGVGCTSPQAAPADGDAVAPASAAESAVPAADEQAIRATIDRLNATAAGDVPDQQSVLSSVVDPAQTNGLAGCGPATTTVRLEPVYEGLRAIPSWTSGGNALAGTVYALPSLIRVYTGDRMTATDLTTLHLGVQGGEAFLTPLCVN